MQVPSRAASPTGVPSATGDAAASFLAGRDALVRETYRRLMTTVERFGPVAVQVKKTSLHLVAGTGGSAFAGVHPQKAALLLTIRTATPLAGPRVRTVDQVSKHRFHNDVLLAAPDEVDDELLGWLQAAYALASSPA